MLSERGDRLSPLRKDKIKLIVYDFDGVMTDNRVHVTQDGKEFVTCNRGDGLGVGMIKSIGIQQVILSTEVNNVVQRRAEKLGLEAIHGSADKSESLRLYCAKHKIDLDTVLYVGNDVNDFEVMGQVAFPVCPADAHPEIKKISQWQTQVNGGYGVIRELADKLLVETEVRTETIHHQNDVDTERVRSQLEQSIHIRQDILKNKSMLNLLVNLADTIHLTLGKGGKIIFAGNGGSFADAQHLAAEFVGRFMVEREPLASICLGTNSSLTTAVGNDYSFGQIFSRELKGIASEKDVLILISTSGNSENLLESVSVAEDMGIFTFGFVGKDGGGLAQRIPCFIVPSEHTARIQELHITIGHILCDMVDQKILSSTLLIK